MFQVGDFVLNFGRLGRVAEVRRDGLLVLSAVRIGKWIADPAKCASY